MDRETKRLWIQRLCIAVMGGSPLWSLLILATVPHDDEHYFGSAVAFVLAAGVLGLTLIRRPAHRPE